MVDIFVKEKAQKAALETKLNEPCCIINNHFVHYLKHCRITEPTTLKQIYLRDITKFEIVSGLPIFYKEIIIA